MLSFKHLSLSTTHQMKKSDLSSSMVFVRSKIMQHPERTDRDSELSVVSAEPLSPHNEALYETGKDMLKKSIDTGRTFCQYMITVATGAIPLYLGLIGFVLPNEYQPQGLETILFSIPPFLFLVGALIFIFGYFPKTDYFSLDIIDEIKTAYEKTVKIRKRYIFWGTFIFTVGTILTIFIIIGFIFSGSQ
jgi:hypothetical protein